MGLSALNEHRKKYNFINNSMWPNCLNPHESEKHFFTECPSYTAQRTFLLADLQLLIPNDFDALKNNTNKLTSILIKRMKNKSIDQNIF